MIFFTLFYEFVLKNKRCNVPDPESHIIKAMLDLLGPAQAQSTAN